MMNKMIDYALILEKGKIFKAGRAENNKLEKILKNDIFNFKSVSRIVDKVSIIMLTKDNLNTRLPEFELYNV